MLRGLCIKPFCILRARGGSSVGFYTPLSPVLVFSAHAEVVPCGRSVPHPENRILRARGGSSVSADAVTVVAGYSPRTRR